MRENVESFCKSVIMPGGKQNATTLLSNARHVRRPSLEADNRFEDFVSAQKKLLDSLNIGQEAAATRPMRSKTCA
jgi:hypothetical protein